MLKPKKLKTEYIKDPIGIDVKEPRFSWELQNVRKQILMKQTAYQIQVASSKTSLENNTPDMWDSGRVISDETVNVVYQGKKLKAKKSYCWRVRVWDEDNNKSEWSDISCWEMGLLDPDDWKAEWITHENEKIDEATPAPYFRKEFVAEKNIEKARLYISGLGNYEAYLNGNKIGNKVLDPGFTDYEETVLYSTFDITSELEKDNCLGVELGRGRYCMLTENTWGWEKPPWKDVPKFLLQLEIDFADGDKKIIISDKSWKTIRGATRYDSLYVGEVYDARKEPVGWLTPGFDDSSWKQAEKADSPQGKIKAGMEPPIKVTNSLSPEQITRIKQDHYVIDFGEMTAGRIKINIRGGEGREIKIKYGEKLTEEGTINLKQDLIEDDIQIDTYICRGNGREIWKPKFSYKGFRFVELINFPENPDKNNIKAEIIHNDVNSTSKFQTSKELFNQIHENCRRAILNNFHSVPTDTPVFEKNGWTGDGQLTAEAAIYNFDMIRFYYKWLEDFKDAQRENGEIPPIVPTSDWGYSDTPWGWGEVKHSVPAWDSAYILIAWWLYQYYGDEQILEKHYSGMKKYVDYLGTRAEGNIVKEGLGDWLAPGGEWEEPYLTSTAYYYLDTKIVARIAEILELEGDKEKYNGLKEEIKDDFNQEFYNKNKNIYEVEGTEEYRQTSNIIPFAFGLVPEKYDKKSILNNLIDDIENKQEGHLNTGIIGTKYILTVLTENGYKDLAYKIAARTTYPSWGYWIKQGATSLYEKWEDDSRSLNHHMYGTIEDWYYKSLAGIKPLKPGYKSIKIKPYLPEKLDEVRAEVETVKGKVISSWKKDKNNIKYEFEVPVNTTAEVLLPLNNIDYSKIKIENREIVEKVDMNEDRVKLIINSGEYLIENVGGGNKFIIVKKE